MQDTAKSGLHPYKNNFFLLYTLKALFGTHPLRRSKKTFPGGKGRRGVNVITHLNLSGQLKNEESFSLVPLHACLACALTTLSCTFIFKVPLYSSFKMYCDFYRGVKINA
jgi:hypothetical protein